MHATEEGTAQKSVTRSTTESVLRRRRLVSMVELARIYGALGVRELADAIGRDKTRIIPPTGNPKLDMIDSLASLLEWTVAEVVDVLKDAPSARAGIMETRELEPRENFETAHRISGRIETRGTTDMSRISHGMLDRGFEEDREPSNAHQMIGRSLMRSGEPRRALARFRRALNENELEFKNELEVKIDLCRAHLRLNHHVEARSVATSILRTIEGDGITDTRSLLNAERDARYVRGNAVRECIDSGMDDNALTSAREDLLRSMQINTPDSGSLIDERTVALGAILELDSELGRITPADAVRRIQEAVDEAHRKLLKGSLSEGARKAWGWWCIFGARIALRHDAPGTHWKNVHALAVRAVDFGSTHCENELRARAYQLCFRAWKKSRTPGHQPISWHLEPNDLTLFVKTMGAKIGFMEQGWVILTETGTLERAKSMDPRSWRKGFARA